MLGATLCRYHPFGSGRGWEGDDDDHDDGDDDDDADDDGYDDDDIGGRDHGVQKLQRKNDRDRGRENEGGTKNELWLVYPHDREMKGIAAWQPDWWGVELKQLEGRWPKDMKMSAMSTPKKEARRNEMKLDEMKWKEMKRADVDSGGAFGRV